MFLVSKYTEMWHNGIRVNMIDMVVYHEQDGSSTGRNEDVKRGRGLG